MKGRGLCWACLWWVGLSRAGTFHVAHPLCVRSTSGAPTWRTKTLTGKQLSGTKNVCRRAVILRLLLSFMQISFAVLAPLTHSLAAASRSDVSTLSEAGKICSISTLASARLADTDSSRSQVVLAPPSGALDGRKEEADQGRFDRRRRQEGFRRGRTATWCFYREPVDPGCPG